MRRSMAAAVDFSSLPVKPGCSPVAAQSYLSVVTNGHAAPAVEPVTEQTKPNKVKGKTKAKVKTKAKTSISDQVMYETWLRMYSPAATVPTRGTGTTEDGVTYHKRLPYIGYQHQATGILPPFRSASADGRKDITLGTWLDRRRKTARSRYESDHKNVLPMVNKDAMTAIAKARADVVNTMAVADSILYDWCRAKAERDSAGYDFQDRIQYRQMENQDHDRCDVSGLAWQASTAEQAALLEQHMEASNDSSVTPRVHAPDDYFTECDDARKVMYRLYFRAHNNRRRELQAAFDASASTEVAASDNVVEVKPPVAVSHDMVVRNTVTADWDKRVKSLQRQFLRDNRKDLEYMAEVAINNVRVACQNERHQMYRNKLRAIRSRKLPTGILRERMQVPNLVHRSVLERANNPFKHMTTSDINDVGNQIIAEAKAERAAKVQERRVLSGSVIVFGEQQFGLATTGLYVPTKSVVLPDL